MVTPSAALAPADVRAAAADLEDAPAEAVLRWAVAEIPRFAVTSSFGVDAAVLLHLVARVDVGLPVLFLDTGFHFPETLAYRRELAEQLGLTGVRDVRPQLSVTQQASEHGGGLYLRDPDTCCRLRKVAPLDTALAGFDGWASGVRRDQTANRKQTPIVRTVRRGDRELIKVAPLARWASPALEAYRRRNRLPPHPLAAAGFPSIGCAPCTRWVAPGEDPRAGRWADATKTECGIHLEPSPNPD